MIYRNTADGLTCADIQGNCAINTDPLNDNTDYFIATAFLCAGVFACSTISYLFPPYGYLTYFLLTVLVWYLNREYVKDKRAANKALEEEYTSAPNCNACDLWSKDRNTNYGIAYASLIAVSLAYALLRKYLPATLSLLMFVPILTLGICIVVIYIVPQYNYDEKYFTASGSGEVGEVCNYCSTCNEIRASKFSYTALGLCLTLFFYPYFVCRGRNDKSVNYIYLGLGLLGLFVLVIQGLWLPNSYLNSRKCGDIDAAQGMVQYAVNKNKEADIKVENSKKEIKKLETEIDVLKSS